jgi:hypothetical protein
VRNWVKSEKQSADALLDTSLTSQAHISKFAFKVNLYRYIAACFCDGAVVGEINARNATFFQNLLDFTPMACGFRIKTGEVCTDMKALENFITAENIISASGDDTAEVASVEDLISDGGALVRLVALFSHVTLSCSQNTHTVF